MLTGDTIAAISSAVGPAARMIVRASGPKVQSILSTVVPAVTQQAPVQSFARFYPIEFGGLRIPAWVYLFIAPRSYSGEDLIELHIPGNAILARRLLQELIRLGARPAEPGEFTARAYFNGRIDLAQAEGVAAVIAAQGDRQLAAARQLLAGELARRLGPIMEAIAQTLALLESGIDFSEEDISFLSQEQLTRQIAQADAALVALLNDSERFERVSHEPRIVLVGRPNAGKSTLLNALCGLERAIVSSQAGTTRDAIWAPVHLKRGTARMIDVAGLDDAAEDEISRQMQQRARQVIEQADRVIVVRDGQDDRPPLELQRVDFCVISKADLHLKAKIADDGLVVSALTGQNMDRLRDRLDELAFGDEGTAPEALALNSRHIQAIQDARDALARTADMPSSPEVVALELRESLDALGRVLGSITPDDVLGRIFATFCVGK